MKRCVLSLAALGTALTAASCASDPEDAAPITSGRSVAAEVEVERDCFNTGSISGFRIVDADTVQLNIGASTSYEVDAGGATCTNLEFANQIALDAGGPSSFLCVGDGPQTASIRTDQGDECLIGAVRRVPPPAPAASTAAAGAP